MWKVVFIFILFLGLPYIFSWLLKHGMTRKPFSLAFAATYGSVLFLLTVLFGNQEYRLAIAIFMFISMIVGGYPSAYFLYPSLARIILRK
jgi:hypothetical protein